MGQILHGSATTTHIVRAAIQRSKAPLKELAAQYGLNHKTVSKWRKRVFVNDAPMRPEVCVICPSDSIASSMGRYRNRACWRCTGASHRP